MFHITLKRWRPLLWAGLLTLAALLAWQAATARTLMAAEQIAPSAPWQFVDESKPGAPAASGVLTAIATDAPTQVAARFNISSTMQALALQLSAAELGGLPLAQVEELGYCTRLLDGPRPYAVTLQLNIDPDVTDADTTWQGRLVYTPAYNGAVIQGEWQCWNTLIGKWWATGGPVAEKASAENPLPLGTLLAHFPNMGINANYGAVVLKAGDGWSYFEGEASPVVIGVEGERLAIAFGDAPQAEPLGNEVLLPVLLNEQPPRDTGAPAAPDAPPDHAQNDNKNKDKDKDKEKSKDKDKPAKWEDADWNSVDWGNFDWENLDWDALDWEKIEWDKFEWGIMGWRGNGREEAMRAFIEDVKQCNDRGWESAGFSTPGDCVAYYVQLHTPPGLNWEQFDWGSVQWEGNWHNDDGDDGDDDDNNNQGGRNRRDRRGDD